VFDPDEILRVLHRHRVEFVLIGGMAATLHGSDIVTFDLDVSPKSTRDNLERLASVLRELGASLRVEGEPSGVAFDAHAELLERMQVLNLATRAGDLDIVVRPAGSTGYDDLRRDAIAISISGVPILVASLADIIRSKEAANREKDRAVLPALNRLQMRLAADDDGGPAPLGA
jgi:hypothetical protein